MAASPSSRHRSRLIREMARDLNRHDYSCASSTGSNHGTVSDDSMDFDPENEAIESTRRMDIDFSQKLPEMRDTAKKFGRWTGRKTNDFVINTSAIGRAFPDFSQGGSSDESTFHIEAGRGAKTRQRTPSKMPRVQYSDNISPVVNIGDFKVMSTPPAKGQAKAAPRQDPLRNNARKESQSKPSAPQKGSQNKPSTPQKENVPPSNVSAPVWVSPYISGATRTSSGEQRRTLAEIHARVADDSEGSFISDERPATVTFQQKQSRFTGPQPKGSPLSAMHNIPRPEQVKAALVQALSGRRDVAQETPSRPPRPQNNSTQNSNGVSQTNQSFLLPNMPDLSELVSGSFKDGTPVFTNGGKAQAQSGPGSGKAPPKPDVHTVLDSVPIPDEERAIYISLQLLQDKVAMLEMEKADRQNLLRQEKEEKYELQNVVAELQRRRRSDSALGMADSGSDGDYAQGNKKLVAEKTKLEAQLKSLQTRVGDIERKSSNQEQCLKTISFERDQAARQLGEAYYITEQLQSENDSLRKENGNLKLELARANNEFEDNTREWKHKEIDIREGLRKENGNLKLQLARLNNELEDNTREWKHKETDLREKLKRRDAAVAEMREMTQEIKQSHQENVRTVKSRKVRKESNDVRPTIRGRVSIGQTTVQQEPARERSRSRSQSRRITNDEIKSVNPFVVKESFDIAPATNVDDEFDASDEGSFDDTTKTIHKDINLNADEDRTQGSNYSSILGHGEMDRMREILAYEKARKANIDAGLEDTVDDTVMTVRSGVSARSARSVQSAPGKTLRALSSILKNRNTEKEKEMTGQLSMKSDTAGQDDTGRPKVPHARRNSDTSVNAQATHCRIASNEMTSAFIMPDITLNVGLNGAQHPVLSAKAKKVLDNLCHHDGGNCTVCSRVASFERDASKAETKRTVRIQKPIPVSERMPVPGPFEDEPTMRPSVAPGLALAAVMKGLEDELAHLKMGLAQYQSIYSKLDPSISMRKRKAVKSKIEDLLKAIDTKADQIYALYDVLEGQKQSGQELSEEEVEVTLMDIGIDVDALKIEKPQEEAKNDSGEDSDLDLPWEGIEDTTGSNSANGRRRSWAA